MNHKSTTHREQFIHVKAPLVLKGKSYKGGTVFFRWESDGVYASVARCSSTDNWCKSYGRNVARRRYFQRVLFNRLPAGASGMEKASYELADHLYRNA